MPKAGTNQPQARLQACRQAMRDDSNLDCSWRFRFRSIQVRDLDEFTLARRNHRTLTGLNALANRENGPDAPASGAAQRV